MRFALFVLLSLSMSGSLLGSDPDKKPQDHPEFRGALRAADAWLEAVRHYERVPGLSVGIVLDQDLVWRKGYGSSNLESGRSADADTIYSICSISKLFTSIGVLQLRDRGELRLDETVGAVLPWYDLQQVHEGSAPQTLESLLTHSSGLPREAAGPYWDGPRFDFPTREKMIEGLSKQQTLYPSQRLYQYSNLGMSLLGEVIQERSKTEYADYVQRQILEPLGMEDTRPRYPLELRGEQLAIGYTGIDRRLSRDPVPPFDTRAVTAAAGFTSTVRDLARFASWQFRLLDGRETEVLAPNTLREMHRVHWLDSDWKASYGLGFSVRRQGGHTVVGHGGGCPGYITQFALVPELELGVIVLTNAGDGPAWQLTNGLISVLSQALKASGSPTEPAKDLSDFEVTFTSSPWGGEMAVRQWGDQLVAIELPTMNPGDLTVKLRHVEGDRFVRLTDSGQEREPWLFERDADGRVVRLVVHGNVNERVEGLSLE
ncbi:MAG: serine hydrolase [Acidobacteriota bacterium]